MIGGGFLLKKGNIAAAWLVSGATVNFSLFYLYTKFIVVKVGMFVTESCKSNV